MLLLTSRTSITEFSIHVSQVSHHILNRYKFVVSIKYCSSHRKRHEHPVFKRNASLKTATSGLYYIANTAMTVTQWCSKHMHKLGCTEYMQDILILRVQLGYRTLSNSFFALLQYSTMQTRAIAL